MAEDRPFAGCPGHGAVGRKALPSPVARPSIDAGSMPSTSDSDRSPSGVARTARPDPNR